MDIDKEFVRAVVRGGKEAVLAAIDRNVDKEIDIGKEKGTYLFGDGKKAWQFLREHFSKYDEVPSLEIIESSLGIDLSGSMNESYLFFLDEIFKRRLWQLQRHGTKDVSEKLESKDPTGAAEVWIEIHRKIQEEALTVRKVESLLSLGKQVIADYKDAKAGKRGIPTPWPSMDAQTLGWWPEDLVLFVGRLGVGKCVSEDTDIIDPETGVCRRIADVFAMDDHRRVTTWSKSGGVFSTEITAKIDTGRKECLRITLGTGRSVVVTPEHPVMTPDGWSEASTISVGSSLAIPHKMPFPEKPVSMDDAEVDILSILLSEGSYSGNHVGFSSTDDVIISIAKDAASKLGAQVRYRSGCDYDFVGIKEGKSIVRQMLRGMGIDRKKAIEKSIPDDIYRLPPRQLSRFISLFWMCDGYVDATGPCLVLASKRMVEQFQSLLLRFGIQSSVSYKKSSCDGKNFDSWRLRVYASSWDAFASSVVLWGEKNDRFQDLFDRDRNSNIGMPMVSMKFKERIKEIIEKSDRQMIEVGSGLGWASKFCYRNLFGNGGTILLRRFKVFCEVFGCVEEFSWMWNPDIFWDRVVSVESVGDQKIFDLTVDPTSCFVGNDIILHNTWSLVICAHKAWAEGKKVLVVSTEMNKMQMARRFFALHLKLPYDEIRRGKLGEFVESKFFEGVEDIMGADGINIVAGDFDYSIDNISAVVSDTKPHLMCLDGPYLIKNIGKDRHEKVSNTFDDLKKIGKRTGVATITNLQFNRSAKTGQSQTIAADNIGITDVAGWNADAAYGLLQSEEMRANWEMGLKGLKIREGMPDEFKIHWNHNSMDFSEINGSNVVQAAIPKASPGGGGGADNSFAAEDDDFDDVPF